MMEKREKSSQYVSSKMVQSTKASGSWTRTRKTAAEFKFGQTAQDTTASGEMVWPMAMADLSTPKETFTKENGQRIRPMAMVYTPISMDQGMRANGSRISNMALVLSSGQMVQSTRASMNRA